MSIVSAARLLFSCPLLLGFARYCGATTERVDDLGVPILNKDDRSADMPDNDGADAIVRRVHGGWYLVYRPPRDTHETPIAMRMQTMYWKVHASVIAATKNTNMLDPIIQPDGTYRTPTYRLSDEQIDALYEDELELWEYRACALASVRKEICNSFYVVMAINNCSSHLWFIFFPIQGTVWLAGRVHQGLH